MDFHFSELLVILLVALLVIKPEHLPNVAFKIGRGLSFLRQAATKIKKEFEPHD